MDEHRDHLVYFGLRRIIDLPIKAVGFYWWVVSVAIACATLFWVSSSAAQKPDPRADQVVGMFTKTCLQFPGVPAELRTWIGTTARLAELPPDKAIHFLGGRRGVAWPATNGIGEFVIVSHDDGLCTVFARRASAPDVVRLVETLAFRTSGYTLAFKDETPVQGQQGPARTRTYTADKTQMRLDVVVTLSEDANAPFQAVLSARPQPQPQ